MLKVSLKQFMGLGLLVDDMMEKYNISYDLVPYIELYIGDPDKNGSGSEAGRRRTSAGQ